MKRTYLMIFLVILSVANLVFAADWHEPDQGAALEPVAHSESSDSDTDHSPDRSASPTEHNHAHPPGGSCSHTHSCHAHAHLFSMPFNGHQAALNAGHQWQALSLPMPHQHFMAPDVPPPIA